MRPPSESCRDARTDMVEALLESPRERRLPTPAADHLAACPECAAHWRSLQAATQLFAGEPVYGMQLRSRTLESVARAQEPASANIWLWLAPATVASVIAAYGIPTYLLTDALESVLGSVTSGLGVALMVVCSLTFVLPATLAIPLLRLRSGENGVARFGTEVPHE